MAKSLTDLETAARAHCDAQNSNAPAPAVVWGFVNEAIEDLVRIMRECDDSLFLTFADFTITTGNTAPLPADFDSMSGGGIDLDPTSPRPKTVRPFNFQERNRQPVVTYAFGPARSLMFMPASKAPGNYRIWYAPVPEQLDVNNPTTSQLSASLNQFYKYIVIKAALDCLGSIQDPDVGTLPQDLLVQEALVRNACAHRDSEVKSAPDVRGTVQSDYLNDPFFWGWQ